MCEAAGSASSGRSDRFTRPRRRWLTYTRAYHETHRCDDTRLSGEEPAFTGNFQEPMVQLQSLKTILCISHATNTVSKQQLPLAPVSVGLKEVVTCKASLSF